MENTNRKEAENKAIEMMAAYRKVGEQDMNKCAKLALVSCKQIINETLEEYTNDENHDRVLFYEDVKKWLNDFISLPPLNEIHNNVYGRNKNQI